MTHERLVALVSECIARMDEEGPGVLDSIAAREPELADALRERIRRLRDAGLLEDPTPSLAVPERLGEFKLLRRIASGGMGVVYEAEQASIGRRVALKLIRPESLYFAGARERFRREVEAVARLSHPGIAQIYAYGEEGELPYFAMEFVEGASLGDALLDVAGRTPATLGGQDLAAAAARRASSSGERRVALFADGWCQACVRVVREACAIVDHAHAAGVLHRDLKPSNVLVTPAGRVVVVDFGLATLEGADKLTRTGSQLGSLPYMAPEQLRGDAAAIGPATDVYALGVTLYELLTLRLPHEARSAAMLERAIATKSPRPLRAQNPGVSNDLETIVLTALAADPRSRYATPGALADDLGRWLEHRPVLARRAGPVERVLRWTKRRPAAAVATLLGLALVVTAAVTFALWRDNERETRAANEVLATQVGAALKMIEVVAARGGEGPLEEVIAASEAAARALESSASAAEHDPKVLTLRVTLQRSLGGLFAQVGRHAEAEHAFREALAAVERIGDDVPYAELRLLQAIDSAGMLDASLAAQARHAEALDACGRAVELAERLARVAGDEYRLEARASLAAALANRAQRLRILGRQDEARADYERSDAAFGALVAEHPEKHDFARLHGMALTGFAMVELDSGRAFAAYALWERALGLAEDALRRKPDDHRALDEVATLTSRWARALIAADCADDARSLLDRSDRALARLIAEHPEVSDYRQRSMQNVDSRAWLEQRCGTPGDVLAGWQACVELAEELAVRHPETTTYLEDWLVALNNCAQAELGLGLAESALRRYERALRIHADLGPVEERTPRSRERAFVTLLGFADTAGVLDRYDRAMEALCELERELLQGPQDAYDVAAEWADVDLSLSTAVATDGRSARRHALDLLRSALELGWRDADELERNPVWAKLRAEPEFRDLLAAARRAREPSHE